MGEFMSGTPLVTLQDYKIYKKLSKTDSDGELQLIIDSVSSMVKTYLGHTLLDYYSTPKVEYFNIRPGQSTIQLNEWPLQVVTLIETREDYLSPYTTLDPVEYFVDFSVDSVYINGRTTFWQDGLGAVRITYTAGYDATPPDIKIACLDLVHHYFKEEYKERKSIGNASVDNTSGRSQAMAQVWPVHISRVLDMYRNV
jgi:hypothetical protein